MGADTKIQWCHHTFNPWIGCDKVSAGCKNCYAEVETYSRVSKARGLPLWGPKAARHRTKTWGDPKRWNRKAREARVAAEAKGEPYERPRVFCASLCDVFESRPDLPLDAWRAELWKLVEECDEIDWMLLTKRIENILFMVPGPWLNRWPPHVWIGTSVEDQDAANERIPHLVKVPARIHFLSMEPLLGEVNLMGPHLWEPSPQDIAQPMLDMIDLVIVGGEGHGGRPCDVDWIRSIVRQCREARVACFVKQLGSWVRWDGCSSPGEHWPDGPHMTDGHGIGGWRVHLAHPKGGDPAEWPADLCVREMPQVRR